MAMQVLERQNVYDPDLLIYRTALGMIRSASLNCYIFDVSAPCFIMRCASAVRLHVSVVALQAQAHRLCWHHNLSCSAGREE